MTRMLNAQSQVTDAFLGEQSARWAVQQNRLEALQLLDQRGGVSWKELAEQQQIVSQLKRRIAALERFREFLTTLAKEHPSDSQELGNPVTYLCFHPEHSARVVGWIRADQATENVLERVALDQQDNPENVTGTVLSEEIQEAQARLARAQKTVELASVEEERFQKTARLELDLVRATLELLKAIEDQHNTINSSNELTHQTSIRSTATEEVRLARVGTPFVTMTSLELSALTLRSIQLETELASPDSLELQRKFTQDHLQTLRGMQKFQAFNHREIQTTEEELRLLSEEQKANSKRVSKLKEDAEALEKSAPTEWRTVVEKQLQRSPRNIARFMVPEQLRLRFEQLRAEMRLGDLQAEGDFLKEYLKRLTQVAADMPSAVPDLARLQYRVQLNRMLCEETRRGMMWLAIEQRRLELHSDLLTNGVATLVQGEQGFQPNNESVAQTKEGVST
ncbi:MAG: hypothetical protein KDA84_09990, partial [Planctomycetaceae bacterium]|nr:hypothetical protein [Planctomycetaceae bacterium]